jgi:hypothetical protein
MRFLIHDASADFAGIDLWDVFPYFFPANSFYSAVCYLLVKTPNFICTHPRFSEISNFSNFNFSQFIISHSFSPSSSSPKHSICHILRMSSFVKVVVSTTQSIIALMKNHFSFLDFPMFKYPRKTVRPITVKINAILSIVSDNCSLPNPTGISFFYFRPKSVNIFLCYFMDHFDVLSISGFR